MGKVAIYDLRGVNSELEGLPLAPILHLPSYGSQLDPSCCIFGVGRALYTQQRFLESIASSPPFL